MVETFIIEETEELIHDAEQLARWQQLVDELGLEGQETIASEEKSPIPFLYMNAKVKRIFEILCPVKVEVAKYNKTPIPVEILALVKLSKDENYFTRIHIWYDDKTPDPVCVGELSRVTEEHKYAPSDYYLIGRWADVKADFKELEERASELLKIEKISSLNQKIADCNAALSSIDNLVKKDISGDSSWSTWGML